MKPSRIIATSIVRHAGLEQASGFVRIVDVEGRRILSKSATPESVYRVKDTNPRGGLRGARGIGVCKDKLVIANSERLFVFDSTWKLVGEITHPLMGEIHEILVEEDGIWVTCTGADLLLKVDWQGKISHVWEWRQHDQLVEALGFSEVPRVDRAVDYRDPESARDSVRNLVHLNAVTRAPYGILLSFGRILSPGMYRRRQIESLVGRLAKRIGFERLSPPSLWAASLTGNGVRGSTSAMVHVGENGRTSVLSTEQSASVPNHNVVQWEDQLVRNDSNSNQVVIHPLEERSGRERRIKIPGRKGFLRGLVQLHDSTFLIGNQNPASICRVDVESEGVSPIDLEGEPRESVFALCRVPSNFSDPPPRLF